MSNRTDITLGLLFLVISGVVYYLMRDFPTGTMEEGMGSAFFPGCLVAALAALSLLLIIGAISSRGDSEEGKGGGGSQKTVPIFGSHLRAPAAVTVAVVIYLTVIGTVGFLIATPLLILAVMKLFRSGWWRGLLVGVALTGALFVIFGMGLRIPLPVGDLWGY